ncbi:MAG TPA: phosphoribosylanthranilate isomerase [Rhizomicrobium sp.]|nr:phosphoribosylanthranilate isomerase [Rhizomicrobium sp.]
MTVQVKICGLTRPEDVGAVAAAGADFAGLVFHPGSPRHLRPEQARAIAERLRGRVRVVALLVNPTDAALADAMAAAKPDFVQLHGSEPPARVAELRALSGKPVIKAMGISDEADFELLPAYETVADMLLFDAKPLPEAIPGGLGRAFDWRLLRTRTIRKPWLLAGGLDAENVGRAISGSGARGVDVSSGVERAPGVKDGERIRAFVAAARTAEFATEERA